MLNPHNNKEIVFPHIIYGSTLDGKHYDWNNVNGGVKSIGAFGLTSNTFFGGRSVLLGYITELGFWGCQDKNHKENLIGFYLADPDTVTVLGRTMIKKAFPMYTVKYMKYTDIPVTKVDIARLERARREYLELGGSPQVVDHAAVETLESLIKAKKFEWEQAQKAEGITEEPAPPQNPAPKPAEPKKTASSKKTA